MREKEDIDLSLQGESPGLHQAKPLGGAGAAKPKLSLAVMPLLPVNRALTVTEILQETQKLLSASDPEKYQDLLSKIAALQCDITTYQSKTEKSAKKVDRRLMPIAVETHRMVEGLLGQLNSVTPLEAVLDYPKRLNTAPPSLAKKVACVFATACALIMGAILGAMMAGYIGAWSGPGAAVFGMVGAVAGVKAVLALLSFHTAGWAAASSRSLLSAQIMSTTLGAGACSTVTGMGCWTKHFKMPRFKHKIDDVQASAQLSLRA